MYWLIDCMIITKIILCIVLLRSSDVRLLDPFSNILIFVLFLSLYLSLPHALSLSWSLSLYFHLSLSLYLSLQLSSSHCETTYIGRIQQRVTWWSPIIMTFLGIHYQIIHIERGDEDAGKSPSASASASVSSVVILFRGVNIKCSFRSS